MNSVLGIFGGTFDPIHCGHLELAREVRAALGLSAVRFIPAGDPPHRAAPVATAAHRLAMVELAVAGHPGLEVDAREIAAPRAELHGAHARGTARARTPARPLALIVGADAFLGLPTWHRWRELFELAHVVVVARPGVALEDALPPALADEWARRLRDGCRARSPRSPRARSSCQPITAHPISASAIRAQLARGADGVAAVRGLLPAAVLAYIERNQLYRSRPDAT